MKTLVISSTLLLALAALANAKPHHELPPHKQAAKDACLTKLDLTEEKLHESKKSDADGNVRHCFFACINKEIGLLNAEGNIDKEVAIKELPHFVPEDNRTKIVDACYQLKGADDCETSKLYHDCVKKSVPRPPKNPEFEKIVDSCKEKLSLTDDNLHAMKWSAEEPKKDCFKACIGQSIGFLNEDGSFNQAIFNEKAAKKEEAQKAATECGKEALTSDPCESAAILHKCFKKNDFKIGDFFGPPPSPSQTE